MNKISKKNCSVPRWCVSCTYLYLLHVFIVSFVCVCCFFGGGRVIPLENFSLIWRRNHCRWKAANWPMLRTHEHWDSLACPTCCDTGHPFIMITSENPWHSHLLPYLLGLSRLGFEHQTFRLRGECSDPYCFIICGVVWRKLKPNISLKAKFESRAIS